MDSYEIINGKPSPRDGSPPSKIGQSKTPTKSQSPTIEDIGPEYDGADDNPLSEGEDIPILKHAKCKEVDDDAMRDELMPEMKSSRDDEVSDEKHPDLRKRATAPSSTSKDDD